MKQLTVLLMAGALSLTASKAATAALAASAQEENRMHTEITFDVLVHAPYDETAVLFGPVGERAWAGKHWDPQYLYPLPARDQQGGVFTIQHASFKAVWVIARHDVKGRHFQYVYFIPGILVTTIDVRFQVVDPKTTKVTVTYARTAVTPEGDEHVKVMTEGDQASGKEWQAAIDD